MTYSDATAEPYLPEPAPEPVEDGAVIEWRCAECGAVLISVRPSTVFPDEMVGYCRMQKRGARAVR